ncbi:MULTISPECIES: Arc family DNA-binding protein [Cronobacter]|uniref:Arc family DNA-binding protein n=1 Tax=Cronobacter TaxID=413496 RepID=UPI000D3E01C5|nr:MULTISPECIES: Arc family DNA-binding protein [Cronobacter]EIZ9495585.1 Arc family DNA-binding protein [Cronobacter sakazakii]ELY3999425.1 Arc family DNA-binding protein [Cronobacter sakazakii]ELY4528842.1 Arc family DNA-binding protein [Cronobacter sakazakii]NCH03845.1 Arc family DNA-binding protein [Cronobacter malonaticus]NCH31178.1 Arc family DNA-binding protein [Cronobacter malonaticus]
MEKNEAKTTLRYPQSVKEEFKKIAEEEGLSENAALVQALVWALKFRGQMNGGRHA